MDKLSRIWADGFVETNDGSNVNDDFQISPCIWTASRLSTAVLSRHQTAARPQTDGDKIFDHWPAAQANNLKQFPFSIFHYTSYIITFYIFPRSNQRICEFARFPLLRSPYSTAHATHDTVGSRPSYWHSANIANASCQLAASAASTGRGGNLEPELSSEPCARNTRLRALE